MQREGGKDDGVDECLKITTKKSRFPHGFVRTHDKFTLFSLLKFEGAFLKNVGAGISPCGRLAGFICNE